MAEDNAYSDIEPATAGGPSPPEQGATEGGETALIPKSILMGREYKVGETIPLKVVHLFEDEIEVQCPPKTTEEQEPEEEAEPAGEMTPDQQLERMAVPAS